MKKIRFGIIGCGKMMASHVAGIQHVENVEVTAFCDIIRENAQELAHGVLMQSGINTSRLKNKHLRRQF